MALVDFPTERTRAACFACFDFAAGWSPSDNTCPACGRPIAQRLSPERRPSRPSMFEDTPQ